MNNLEMNFRTYNKFVDKIYKNTGIIIGDDKISMLSARFARRVRELKLTSYDDYFSILEGQNGAEELSIFIDSVTTNLTNFYREKKHFETLETEIKELLDKGKRKFRIWCSAASTGEEPYSLAITLSELFETYNVDWKILATDISSSVLQKAKDAKYPESELKLINEFLIQKYFNKVEGGSLVKTVYQIKSSLKNRTIFRRLNLADFPYPLKGETDIIFCRNVLIYFDDTLREKIVAQFYHLLKRGGLLFLGHTESLIKVPHKFENHSTSVYRKG